MYEENNPLVELTRLASKDPVAEDVLREFNPSFVNAPYLNDENHFGVPRGAEACKQCNGGCCTGTPNMSIEVDETETHLFEGMPLKHDETRHHTNCKKVYIYSFYGTPCVYFNEKKCSCNIYDKKPLSCRVFSCIDDVVIKYCCSGTLRALFDILYQAAENLETEDMKIAYRLAKKRFSVLAKRIGVFSPAASPSSKIDFEKFDMLNVLKDYARGNLSLKGDVLDRYRKFEPGGNVIMEDRR